MALPTPPASSSRPPRRLAFSRHEWAGAVGDLGTDLPLLIGLVAAKGLDPASTFLVFGAFQVVTGLVYGLPMPVQPLKAIATIMITTAVPKEAMFGAGLILGLLMTVLALTNLITRIAALIPHCVVRGIQLGLGMSLMLLALGYMHRDGWPGSLVAAAGVVVVLGSGRQARVPPGLLLIGIGVLVAWTSGFHGRTVMGGVRLALPVLRVPGLEALGEGAIHLAAPQIPLSLANSLIATAVLLRDLFPDRETPNIRRITLTYGLMNLVAPFVSGVPVCHGCGGLAGHYRFGARTGGSVVLYGALYLVLGGLFSPVLGETIKLFPFPILGVLLFFEGLALVQLIRDVTGSQSELGVTLLVGALILGLPYGYAIGAVVGPILFRLARARRVAL